MRDRQRNIVIAGSFVCKNDAPFSGNPIIASDAVLHRPEIIKSLDIHAGRVRVYPGTAEQVVGNQNTIRASPGIRS
jgi:hypothetical protein